MNLEALCNFGCLSCATHNDSSNCLMLLSTSADVLGMDIGEIVGIVDVLGEVRELRIRLREELRRQE